MSYLRVLIYMLGSGGTSPFWAGNNKNTQRKILKAKYTTKIPALEPLSEQIKQLIKRSVGTRNTLSFRLDPDTETD